MCVCVCIGHLASRGVYSKAVLTDEAVIIANSTVLTVALVEPGTAVPTAYPVLVGLRVPGVAVEDLVLYPFASFCFAPFPFVFPLTLVLVDFVVTYRRCSSLVRRNSDGLLLFLIDLSCFSGDIK